MAVQLDLAAIDPSPDFIAYGGKRPETVFLLIDEHLQPGAASLLERRLVVLLELLQHAIAEILKRVETPVAELRDYGSGYSPTVPSVEFFCLGAFTAAGRIAVR